MITIADSYIKFINNFKPIILFKYGLKKLQNIHHAGKNPVIHQFKVEKFNRQRVNQIIFSRTIWRLFPRRTSRNYETTH